MAGVARRVLGVWSALVMLGATVVVASSPVWGSVAPPSPAADPASAAAKARESGQRVEVLSLRTPTVETFANPDGTWTSEVFAVPQRVRLPDGSWVAPDATLVRAGDGSWAPKAATLSMVLSGGGDGPLISVSRGRARLALSWPGGLPVPTVSGAVATYPEVLPGVDLRLRAEVDGFAQVLVVKDRQAAANPALRQLRLGVSAQGVTGRVGEGGSVSWVDGSGAAAFSAGSSVMWDSATLASEADRLAVTGEAYAARAVSSDAGPGVGANQAVMGVAVTDDALTVTPDEMMLSDPETVFPVYIDPQVTPTNSNWSMINKIHPNQSYWAYDRDSGAKVGYEDADDELYRSMFVFPTSGFKGAVVTAATFKATLAYSWSCTASEVFVDKTAAFNSGTTWNNHASTWSYLSYKSAEACDSNPVPLEFASSALTSYVQSAANGSSTITLGLRAKDEAQTGHAGWKKFQPTTAKLTVTYNHRPSIPDQLYSGKAGCATGANRPRVATGSMQATFRDVDGGDVLKGTFQWKRLNADGTYPSTITGSQTITGITPGTPKTATPALTNGQSYAWQVQAVDAGNLASGWTGWCEFTLDITAPPLPKATPPAGMYNSEADATGDVGLPGSFTLDPQGATDVASYTWYLQSANYTSPVSAPVPASGAGHTATITVTPHTAGLNTLYVMSIDSAGNKSGYAPYTFAVASSNPVGWWQANEGAGTVLHDDPSVATPHDATFSPSGASWTAPGQGRIRDGDSALSLVPWGKATTTAPVLNTTKSFTVAAWARLTDVSGYKTVASQEASSYSMFRLQYRSDDGAWCMTLRESDASTTLHKACSSGPPTAGVWTHLVGVYDAPAGRIRLFVNGVLAADQPSGPSWATGGPFAIGRALVTGAAGDHFIGEIDDVRAWQRVIYDDEVHRIANDLDDQVPNVVGDWQLEGDGGDWSDFGAAVPTHMGTLTGGASWTSGWNSSSQGVALDGTTGAVTFTGPVIRTDQSFTVSAWVKIADTANYYTVVSQAGSVHCGFYLQYSMALGRWTFISPMTDSLTPGGYWTAKANAAPAVNTWTHLVGVYDAGAHTMALYVGTDSTALVRQTTVATGVTLWPANGPWQIGSCATVAGNFVKGAVDEVKVYAGALSDAEIAQL